MWVVILIDKRDKTFIYTSQLCLHVKNEHVKGLHRLEYSIFSFNHVIIIIIFFHHHTFHFKELGQNKLVNLDRQPASVYAQFLLTVRI